LRRRATITKKFSPFPSLLFNPRFSRRKLHRLQRLAPDARANALFYPFLIIYSTVVNQSGDLGRVRGSRGPDAGTCNRPAHVNAPLYALVQLVNIHASAVPRRACPSSVN